MVILEILKKRRSIRKYQTRPVENEKIQTILEAARLGPSANNQQPCQFIVVTQPEAKQSLKAGYDRTWFWTAPAIIVGCVNPKEAWHKSTFGDDYSKVDLAIAIQNMVLAATDLGLGTCWVANFEEKAVKKALNIPNDVRVLAMTPIGYADEELGPVVDRKPLEKIVHHEKW